jgi:hypothetical protein
MLETETIEPETETPEALPPAPPAEDDPGEPDAETAPPAESAIEPTAYAPEPAREPATLDLLRAHDRAMRELAGRIATVKSRYIDAKELASDLKKQLDAHHETLAAMARSDLTFGPLFDSVSSESPIEPAVDPNAWRSVAIDALLDHGVSAKHVEKLRDADITTLGKLADMSASGLSWYADIKGIGEAAAEKIQDAAQAWHLANMATPVSDMSAGPVSATDTDDEWWIKPVEALEAHGTTPDDSAYLRACGFTSTEAMIDCPVWGEFGATEEQCNRTGTAFVQRARHDRT